MTAQPRAYHLLVDLWHRVDVLPRIPQAMVSRPSPQRTKTVQDASVTSHGGAVLHEFPPEGYKGHRAVRETHYIREKIVREGNSGPPLHIHLRQTETFEVEQGVLGVVKNGVEYAIRKEDGPVTIEPGTRFWFHATATEDLIFNVWVEPDTKTVAGQHGFDEAFIRNFASYLNDCEGHKNQKGTTTTTTRPSIFQLLLFLYDGDMVLTPPFWLPLWLLVGLHHVLAYWVGAGVLGYKASYPEYSN